MHLTNRPTLTHNSPPYLIPRSRSASVHERNSGGQEAPRLAGRTKLQQRVQHRRCGGPGRLTSARAPAKRSISLHPRRKRVGRRWTETCGKNAGSDRRPVGADIGRGDGRFALLYSNSSLPVSIRGVDDLGASAIAHQREPRPPSAEEPRPARVLDPRSRTGGGARPRAPRGRRDCGPPA